MDKYSKIQLARVRRFRCFPLNTCPASRHAQIIGEALVRGRQYPMLVDEAEHCGGSILSTVGSLYDVRTKLAEAYALIAKHSRKLPKNKITTKAVAYVKEKKKLHMG